MEIAKTAQSRAERREFIAQLSQHGKEKLEAKEAKQEIIEHTSFDGWMEKRELKRAMQSALTEGLTFTGELAETKPLELYVPKENDGVDWDMLELKMNSDFSLNDADKLMRHVNSVTASYVGAKTRLEEQYAGQEDVLAEKLGKLNAMFDRFKQKMIHSYTRDVGGFYERAGNPGIKDSMGESLSAAIDQRVKDMEAMVREEGLYNRDNNASSALLEVVLEVRSLEDERSGKIFSTESRDGKEYYSLNDLQAAGAVAKAASGMNSRELNLMSDEELGIHMAVRCMKTAEMLAHLGVSDKMSAMIKNAFAAYLDQYSGGALSSKGRSSDAYSYALKEYEATGDIREALKKSAQTYLGDAFFNTVYTDKNGVGMARFTRYQFELDQFNAGLRQGNMPQMLASIAGNRVYAQSSPYA